MATSKARAIKEAEVNLVEVIVGLKQELAETKEKWEKESKELKKVIESRAKEDEASILLKEQRQAFDSMMIEQRQIFDEWKKQTENPQVTTTPINSTCNLESIVHSLADALKTRTNTAILDLPEFDGDYKMWPRFKAIFDKTNQEGKLSTTEQLARLSKSLKGNAAQSVSRLMIDPANVSKIIDRLEEEYGNAKIVYKALLADLMQNENPSLSKPKTFLSFIRSLDDLVTNMTVLKKEEYLTDPRLLDDLVDKLPEDLKREWLITLIREKEEGGNSRIKTLNDFLKWLKPTEKLAILLNVNEGREEAICYKNLSSPIEPNPNRNARTCCHVCQGDHRIIDCRRFRGMRLNERWDAVRRFGLCTNCCNNRNHNANNCRLPPQCREANCHMKHHPLLHYTNKSQNNLNTLNHHSTTEGIFYQIIPVSVIHEDKEIDTFAFIDTGSSASLLLTDIKESLGVQGIRKPLALTWTNGEMQEEATSELVNLQIRGMSGLIQPLKGLRTIREMNLPSQTLNANSLKTRYKHFDGIDLPNYIDGAPTILLGLPHAHLICGSENRVGGPDEPIAIKTSLGWSVLGKGSKRENKGSLFVLNEKCDKEEKGMEEIMKEFFTTEGFGVQPSPNIITPKHEERALNLMKNTLRPLETGYEIGLLWKEDDINHPESYTQALRRLQGLERRLEKDVNLKNWYHNEISLYCQKGYAKEVNTEIQIHNRNLNYIPHFAVVNLNKLNPKPRLVFDAAARNMGISLNSQLLTGPDAVPPLIGILLRFREGSIGVSGDIQEMFHRIRIRADDRCAQRFLYRESPKHSPKIMEMRVMIFGASCSPACAQYVKNYNAGLFRQRYPEAVKAIENNHYVDDYLDSFMSLETATQRVNEVILIHNQADFFIRNFISNSSQLTNQIPCERISTQPVLKISEGTSNFDKILGQYWEKEKDVFKFILNDLTIPGHSVSKREMLAKTMKIYDPMGLLTNYTIEPKILIQEEWKLKMDWDQNIPPDLNRKWQDWLHRLKELETWELQRCYSQAGEPITRELHTFVDASEQAFAAVTYIRTVHKEGVDMRLVAGKSRVAPLKILTIPRLELQAAVMGTRLADTIPSELRLNIDNMHFWSDSRTVLSWICGYGYMDMEPRRYKQFVAFRVSEILCKTHASEWHWIASKDNPADEATKIIKGDSIYLVLYFYNKGISQQPITILLL